MMFDEHTVNERDKSEALEHYRTHTYNAVMDQVVQSLESRFTSHMGNYILILQTSVILSFRERQKTDSITKFLPDAEIDEIKAELLSFATNCDIFKLSLPLTKTLSDDADQNHDIEEHHYQQHTNESCGSCP